jgi:hypothetical protein
MVTGYDRFHWYCIVFLLENVVIRRSAMVGNHMNNTISKHALGDAPLPRSASKPPVVHKVRSNILAMQRTLCHRKNDRSTQNSRYFTALKI